MEEGLEEVTSHLLESVWEEELAEGPAGPHSPTLAQTQKMGPTWKSSACRRNLGSSGALRCGSGAGRGRRGVVGSTTEPPLPWAPQAV